MLSEGDFLRFVATIFALGFAFAAAVFFGLPWLWSLIAPWLHSVTA